MTSTKLFPAELRNKVRLVATVLNSLNKKEAQQIIDFLKISPESSAVSIAKHLALTQGVANMHLKCLLNSEILTISEKDDEAFFNINYERLSKISSVIARLSQ